MILNAKQLVDGIVETNDKGKPAQVGYDLTIADLKQVSGGVLQKGEKTIRDYKEVRTRPMGEDREMFLAEKGNSYSVTFEQGVKIPEDKTAFIRHRSSLLRMGGIITSGVYDPGFEVNQMGAILFAFENIQIEKGARVAQIYLCENYPVDDEDLYDGQYQKEKDIK